MPYKSKKDENREPTPEEVSAAWEEMKLYSQIWFIIAPVGYPEASLTAWKEHCGQLDGVYLFRDEINARMRVETTKEWSGEAFRKHIPEGFLAEEYKRHIPKIIQEPIDKPE